MNKLILYSILICFALSCALSACKKNETKPASTSTDTTVTPQQATFQINPNDVLLTLAGTPSSDTVTITTTLYWKATASASWIHLDTTQGTGTWPLVISVDTNFTGAVQTGSVTLTPFSNSPAVSLNITVKQNTFNGWKQLSDNTAGLSTNAQPSLVYTYNGNLYFGWGNTGNQTIYRLDTTNYHWVAAITIPSTVQVIQTPTYFILDSKLYVGGGYSTTALSFYEYDMTQGNSAAAWRSLTPLPENMLNGSGFALNGSGYVQTGENTAAGNNVLYQFSTTGSADPGTWTALGPLGITGPLASFVIGNSVYLGCGAVSGAGPSFDNVFNRITPPSLQDAPTMSMPEPIQLGPGQRFSTWAIGNLGYVYDSYTLTLFSYDAIGYNWTTKATIPTTMRVEYATYFNGHVYAWSDTGAVWEYLGQ